MSQLPIYEPMINILSNRDQSVKRCQIYAETLHEWSSARAHLATAIQNYVNKCATLISVCSQPVELLSSNSRHDRTINSIAEALPALAKDEQQLLAARIRLNTLRNRSPSLTPINRLPSEILSEIFILSSLSCIHSDPSHKNSPYVCPVIFASVSTSWRRIALGTATLWSHIDLAPNSSPNYKLYKRARIWIERSNGAPLHIHIRERICAKNDEISELAKFLAPHMKQLSTFSVDTECHSLDLFESALACWLEHGLPGSTRALVLRRPNPIPLLASLGTQELRRLHTQYSREHLDGFMQPLRALHLHNVCIGWGGNHQGLTELHFESVAHFAGPTLSQLVGVLEGCPNLHRLKLAKLKFRYEEMEDLPSVHLKNLEVLDLLVLESSVLKLLLPAIKLGGFPLAMSLTLGAYDHVFEEIKSFFERSNVTALYMDAHHQDYVPLLFNSLRTVQTLSIKDYVHTPSAHTEAPMPQSDDPQPPTICAQLRSLAFIGCDLGLEPLQNMLRAHGASIDALKLWRCKLRTSDSELDKRSDLADILRPILTRLVPAVTQSDHMDDYPVAGWTVCEAHNGCDVRVPS